MPELANNKGYKMSQAHIKDKSIDLLVAEVVES